MKFHITILANIQAIKDIWFVGDQFLREVFYTLPAMKRQAEVRKASQMYIYNQFNVEGFFPSNFNGIRSPFTRILNGVIFGLNKYQKLPRHLVILPDKDLAEYIDKKSLDGAVSQLLGKCTEWLIKEIEKAIDRKKNMLREDKPGSVVVSEPKIIYVRMINRPGNDHLAKIRHKFNAILEDILASRRDTYIMDAGLYLDQSTFHKVSSIHLTSDGKTNYWRAVNENVKKFDKQELSLKPRPSEI